MNNGMVVWSFMRSSGVILLVLLTISLILGVFSTRGNAGGRIPRFLTQDFHRNVSLLSVILLVVHVGTAVVHSYIDVRWFDVFIPGVAVYRPVWLGLGAASLDVFIVAVITSLFRHRINPKGWRAVHVATYAAWVLAVVHGFGIGTDAKTGWLLMVQGACVLAFVSAVSVRLATRNADEPQPAVRTTVRRGVRPQ
jgi:predicted ferric reductase